MKLGYYMGYAPPGTNPTELIELARHAERLGFDSAWAAEAWGTDAVTVLSWLAATTTTIKVGSAIMQIPGRSPANTAMTAMTLDLMSGGRFLLGLGTSGPQVVEGWHGDAWGKPLGKTREYVEIVRTILRRETLEHHGAHYDIPYGGPGATGLGKPLRLMARPLRADIPIYLAALGPKNVELAAEIADGWIPIFFSPERSGEVFGPHLTGAGAGFDVAAMVPVVLIDDVEAGRDALKPMLALYIGGMGSRGKNFYNALAVRYGYEAQARTIQEHYLGGRQREAVAAVPDELVDEVALVGPRERIAERLEAWRACGVTSLLCRAEQPEALEVMAELVL
ncbi:MAG: LLM class F420-dependent oxidoreductase [Gaiellaceae bacterium]